MSTGPPLKITIKTRSRARQEGEGSRSEEADLPALLPEEEEFAQQVEISPAETDAGSSTNVSGADLSDVASEGEESEEAETIQEVGMGEARGPVINPSKFKGSWEENVEEYLQSFERIARANGWDAAKKLVIIPCYLEGAALKWYENLEGEQGDDLTWEIVKAKMKETFQSIAWEEQLEFKLRMRMQGEDEPVEAYVQDIINLCGKIDAAMSERIKIKHVLRGLKPSLLEKVMLMENNSLEALLGNIRRVQTARFMAGQRVDHLLAEPVRGITSTQSKESTPAPQASQTLENKIEHLASEFEKISMKLVEQQRNQRPRDSTPQHHQRGSDRRPYTGAQERGRGARGGFSRGRQENYGRGRTSDGRVICYKCNRVGHYAVACDRPNQGDDNRDGRGRATPPRLAMLCEAHEQEEWHDTWRQYRGRPRWRPRTTTEDTRGWSRTPTAPSHQPSEESRQELNPESVRTIGALEIRGSVNQKRAQIIVDTGACVSCIDETLVQGSRDPIKPVYGVNMKTATDEPVQIIGRTTITLNISQSIMRFPLFVARGLGKCCILGNDFHMKFYTVVDYARRVVQFQNRSGKRITAPFFSREREAKYLRPPPNATWLNQIQLGEAESPAVEVRGPDTAELHTRSHRLLRITYTSLTTDMGVLKPEVKHEPKPEEKPAEATGPVPTVEGPAEENKEEAKLNNDSPAAETAPVPEPVEAEAVAKKDDPPAEVKGEEVKEAAVVEKKPEEVKGAVKPEEPTVTPVAEDAPEMKPEVKKERKEELIERVHGCREDVFKVVTETQKEKYDRRHRHVEYQEGSQVMVWVPVRKKGRSTKLLHRWHGPYKVHKKISEEVNYEIEFPPRGKRMKYYDSVHVNRLKPYHSREERDH